MEDGAFWQRGKEQWTIESKATDTGALPGHHLLFSYFIACVAGCRRTSHSFACFLAFLRLAFLLHSRFSHFSRPIQAIILSFLFVVTPLG